MKATNWFIYISLLILGSLLYSCNTSNKKPKYTGNTIEVSHRLGTTKIPEKTERITVLDIGAIETLSELKKKPTGVPKKFLPSYLSEIKDDSSIEDIGSIIEPNLEAINASNPDLILISTRQERYYEELSKIAPTVFIGVDPKDFLNSFKENIRLLGKIVGKQELAKKKLATLLNKINLAQTQFKDNPHKALFLIYNSRHYSAFGKGSRFGFIHDVLLLKPAINTDDTSVHGKSVSSELIAESNPDYLFIIDRNKAIMGRKTNQKEMVNKLIQETNAYKNDKIFYLNPNLWFLSGGGLISVDLMIDDIVNAIGS